MLFLKKFSVLVISASLVLSGCVTSGGGGGFNVGPQLSSQVDQKDAQAASTDRPRLDVIIPVFDPGLLAEDSKNKEQGIWPELRRAEANRFAFKLKTALEETGAFGAVRVTPDKTATGDLYILGRIEKSDGQNVAIGLQAYDISGDKWIEHSFAHEVDREFHNDIRNKGLDPYDPVFTEAAQYIVKELKGHSSKDLATLQHLTDLRFGASFSESTFSQHMKISGNHVKLLSMPSEDDPMLKRTQAIRVRDQLFVDRLQPNYQSFSAKMDDGYLMWQKESLTELAAEQEAKKQAAEETAVGVGLIALAIFSAVLSAKSESSAGQAAGAAGAVVAGVAGASKISDGMQTSQEAKIHTDALQELSQSVDADLAPQVVEFEHQTVKLTGDAKEQFAQWREFLKHIYAIESTPATQL